MNTLLDSLQMAGIGAFSILQLNERIEELRLKLSDPRITTNDVLIIITDLQSLYKKIILSDLDGAISRGYENYMWNDCFKTPLSLFGRNDKTKFSLMIESGVGFYLGFIQDIGIYFDVPFIKNTTRNLFCTTPIKSVLKMQPSKQNVYYLIQNCLVHVGDLLRYRGSFPEALKMYEKSAAVSPANGQPFNQMGVVQMYMDSKSMDSILATIYYFSRAVSVQCAYLSAKNNLDTLFNKVKGITTNTKLDDFICQFLIGVGSPESALITSSSFVSLLSPLVTTGAISGIQLFRVIIIAIWSWKREIDKSFLSFNNTSENYILEIICSIINSILIAATGFLEINTFYAIPHMKILLDWIRSNTSVLNSNAFRAKLLVGTLCTFLNHLKLIEDDMMSHLVCNELDYVILQEEKKLLGFLPMGKPYEQLQAVMDDFDSRVTPIRICRILRAAEFLSQSQLGFLEKSGENDDTFFNEIPYISQPQEIQAPNKRNVALQSILNQIATNEPSVPYDDGFAGGIDRQSPNTPHPDSPSTDFSLLFRSIWTPIQGESDDNTDGWKA